MNSFSSDTEPNSVILMVYKSLTGTSDNVSLFSFATDPERSFAEYIIL
ncbi:hypothetical protein N0B40_09855 [Chryseobacterium oranimense]|nr:hypothetical protein [Chryseobacterium oranimense]UWX62579.1 hypothetical protein N0B40_09855 [Chryseobacterium oranimense]